MLFQMLSSLRWIKSNWRVFIWTLPQTINDIILNWPPRAYICQSFYATTCKNEEKSKSRWRGYNGEYRIWWTWPVSSAVDGKWRYAAQPVAVSHAGRGYSKHSSVPQSPKQTCNRHISPSLTWRLHRYLLQVWFVKAATSTPGCFVFVEI